MPATSSGTLCATLNRSAWPQSHNEQNETTGEMMTDIKQLYEFSNLCAVVTGGAGVLCAEMCRALASLGAKVAILDLNPANAEKLAAELQQSGGTALGIRDVVSTPYHPNAPGVSVHAELMRLLI